MVSEVSHETLTCLDCVYFKELDVRYADGVCVFDVFQSDTFAQLGRAELKQADYDDQPCRDFKGAT